MGFFSLIFARNPRWLSDMFSCRKASVFPIQKLKNEQNVDGRRSINKSHDGDNPSSEPVKALSPKPRRGVNVSERKYEAVKCTKSNIKMDLGSNYNVLHSEVTRHNNKITSNCTCGKTRIPEKKDYRLFPKKTLTRLFVAIGGVALVTSPVVIAGLWMDSQSNGIAYIYYTHLNETIIIQVLHVLVVFE